MGGDSVEHSEPQPRAWLDGSALLWTAVRPWKSRLSLSLWAGELSTGLFEDVFALGVSPRLSVPAGNILMSFFILVAVGTVPPRITGQNPEQVTTVLNSSVSLPCEALAHPSPEVTWYKDGEALTLGEEVFLLPGG